MKKKLLEMRNITKDFSGVKALDHVNLVVQEGEIHALVGENGAGKSTLMNILSGIYAYGTYEGDIIYDGKICEFHDIKESTKVGIVIIHQELALIPYLTIAENVYLGNECSHHGLINWDETYRRTEQLMKRVSSISQLTGKLSGGNQQKVVLSKWIMTDPDLLILDEPTRGIDVGAKYEIYCIINDLIAQGKSVLMISSEMPELLGMADRIYVMNEGRIVGQMDAAEATQNKIMNCILQAKETA